MSVQTSRRTFLKNSGQLLIGFSLVKLPFAAGAATASLTGPLPAANEIDAWIRIDAEGMVTVLTGKTELGQGIKTALRQMAAEELDVDMKKVHIVIADTAQTPDERYTAGSASIERSGESIRYAAAEARWVLLKLAADRLKSPVSELVVKDGIVTATGNKTSVSYGALLNGKSIAGTITEKAPLKDPSTYKLVGTAYPRDDIKAMATGQPVYIQDMRLPGMLHARVLRPPVYGAALQTLPLETVNKMPGIVKVVRNGSFVGIVAQQEFQAIQALRALQKLATWKQTDQLPLPKTLFEDMMQQRGNKEVVKKDEQATQIINAATVQHTAIYKRPYHMHGSIGPSCAVAEWKGGQLTVWSHSQGVYPLRSTIADLTGITEDKIRVMAVPGPGCYGHNGADDAGGDAALLAVAMEGKPVRVQWMREDEHSWEPYGSAMALQLKAALDAQGNLLAIETELWSDAHSTRPGGKAGALIAGRDLEKPFSFSAAGFSGGSYRNAVPLYEVPKQVTLYPCKTPLRTSALRSLGAYANIFALESFMDELAIKAGKDPADFRLQYLKDERAKAVIRMVTEKTQWYNRSNAKGRGVGIAFAQYKNDSSYFAVVAEVQLNTTTKRYKVVKMTGVIDSGQAVNTDGIANQTSGGMIQSASWTTLEQVHYGAAGITSKNWDSYPILRFNAVPDTEVFVINHPALPPLGAGEAAQGPAAAAIANALFHATGQRLRELPLTPDKIDWQNVKHETADVKS
jgi:nicotinate dehydrogenase subunit B